MAIVFLLIEPQQVLHPIFVNTRLVTRTFLFRSKVFPCWSWSSRRKVIFDSLALAGLYFLHIFLIAVIQRYPAGIIGEMSFSVFILPFVQTGGGRSGQHQTDHGDYKNSHVIPRFKDRRGFYRRPVHIQPRQPTLFKECAPPVLKRMSANLLILQEKLGWRYSKTIKSGPAQWSGHSIS